jgi:predicted nucleotide-binding protein
MYYQIIIEISETVKKFGDKKRLYELDKVDLSEIEVQIIKPYLLHKHFQFDGYILHYDEIKKIQIKETGKITTLLLILNKRKCSSSFIPSENKIEDVIDNDEYATDITNSVLNKVQSSFIIRQNGDKNMQQHLSDHSKVFIVHGKDELAKTEVARFVEQIGLKAIILHEQANGGKTIIEKIEANTDVGFAIILYTPCDAGNLAGENPKPRARQNVIFEHGYLIGRLGRDKVCALVKGDIEKPNDISGVLYTDYDDKGAWKMELAKELREAGYEIDMNKIL